MDAQMSQRNSGDSDSVYRRCNQVKLGWALRVSVTGFQKRAPQLARANP